MTHGTTRTSFIEKSKGTVSLQISLAVKKMLQAFSSQKIKNSGFASQGPGGSDIINNESAAFKHLAVCGWTEPS
jgi:hypothetical protein